MADNLLKTILSQYGNPEKVKIRDEHTTSKLVEAIARGGTESLQIITDFDATLTTAMPGNGGPFSRSSLMPPEFRERSKLRVREHLNIEMNPDLTLAEKSERLLAVFVEGKEDIKSIGLTKANILQVIREYPIPLREHTDTMLDRLQSAGIPVLIFSAGIGDMIQETLRMNELQYHNIQIVSNFMIFGSDEKISGWTAPPIHIFNKNESVIPKDSPFFKELGGAHRPNVILLGDSLGDVTMADGVKQVGAVLKIGFLSNHIEERIASFQEAYDIVLVQDQTMNFVNAILTVLKI